MNISKKQNKNKKMSEKIPNLDLIPNSLGHMIIDDQQIIQVVKNLII